MFAKSVLYIWSAFQMFGALRNLCNTTSICAVFLCAIIVRVQPPAKKSATVHQLVIFRSAEEVVEKG